VVASGASVRLHLDDAHAIFRRTLTWSLMRWALAVLLLAKRSARNASMIATQGRSGPRFNREDLFVVDDLADQCRVRHHHRVGATPAHALISMAVMSCTRRTGRARSRPRSALLSMMMIAPTCSLWGPNFLKSPASNVELISASSPRQEHHHQQRRRKTRTSKWR